MSLGIRLPDFDVLVALYKENPESFEAFRKQLLWDAVGRAPEEQRPALELILKQIDAAREAASNPIESMMLAFKMMQQSLIQLRCGWEKAQYALAELQTVLIIERLRKHDP
ncbi:MAG: hypothetical protein A3I66_01940 [Burkholderiales bacterium RIFCSPLOWO2_02_FULL_57_36]|nr:MAG: hypothetical protein A3I66_01940 [Burkholderiales bacterium RIFCSPLOWO2_02_FULL_57_36]